MAPSTVDRPASGCVKACRTFPGAPGGPAGARLGELRVDAAAWSFGVVDAPALDDRADRLAREGPFQLAVEDPAGHLDDATLAAVADELAIRCQRWSDRRNPASAGEPFTGVLNEHRRLHPLEKPLVWADYRHALDVWQWTLRLEPDAGLALQLAALFHDVERIASEADVRREHTVDDYDGYKARHARESARMADETLRDLGVPAQEREAAAALIAAHDAPVDAGSPAEAAVLADADALSFFALNSAGYLADYGTAAAARKVSWTLSRLGPAGRAWLDRIRLTPAVAELAAVPPRLLV